MDWEVDFKQLSAPEVKGRADAYAHHKSYKTCVTHFFLLIFDINFVFAPL